MSGGLHPPPPLAAPDRSPGDSCAPRAITTSPPKRLASELDPLTRVHNRRGLRGAFEELLPVAHAQAGGTSVALVALRALTEVNDAHGCLEGDRCLRWFASRLVADLPAAEVGRWGGSEFVVLLPATAPEAALELIAGAVERARANPVRGIAPVDFDLSVSVGLSPGHLSSVLCLDELVRLAGARRLPL